ncbi:MAG: hypothetical protein ABJA35_10615 [Parafilimonas sp.]
MQVFFSIFWWIYFGIFFSGFPLVFTFFFLLAKNKKLHHPVAEKIYPLLPVAYAFVSTCFWILMLFTGRVNFVIEKIAPSPILLIVILWSLSSLLFWLATFRKNIRLSFLHSIPLFLLPFLNMILRRYRNKIVDHDYIISLVKIYTAGIIVYIISIVFLLLVKWLFTHIFSRKHKLNESETLHN